MSVIALGSSQNLEERDPKAGGVVREKNRAEAVDALSGKAACRSGLTVTVLRQNNSVKRNEEK